MVRSFLSVVAFVFLVSGANVFGTSFAAEFYVRRDQMRYCELELTIVSWQRHLDLARRKSPIDETSCKAWEDEIKKARDAQEHLIKAILQLDGGRVPTCGECVDMLKARKADRERALDFYNNGGAGELNRK